MFLKELHIAGFKSFAQAVRLELGPGITAVVGPNGSGKSNIVDAVRWVLGEQSMRSLRGSRSEDVIFAGSAARHALGMAEVSLVLDNSDGRVPIDVAEVAIARRLYRSGETEYLLNRRRARLRDVLDAAGHAGLGPDSYCVVGQGTIEQLAMQRPQERRSLIADAADVRRYEARLAEIESDLAQTQQNALRMAAVATEIRPQLDRLRIQAERAERHNRSREELERLARCWFRRAIPAAEGRLRSAEQSRRRSQESSQATRLRLDLLDRREAQLHAEREAVHGRAARARDELAAARARREELRVARAAAGERARWLRSRLDAIEIEVNEVAVGRIAAEQAHAASQSQLRGAISPEPAGGRDHDDEEVARARERVRFVQRTLTDAQRRCDRLRGELDALQREDRGSNQGGLQESAGKQTSAALLARLPARERFRSAVIAALGEAALYGVVNVAGTAWYGDPTDRRERVLLPAHREAESGAVAFREAAVPLLTGVGPYWFGVDVLAEQADAALAARYLGRTIVVPDLTSARRTAEVLARSPQLGPFQVATEDGQCLMSTGERALRPAVVQRAALGAEAAGGTLHDSAGKARRDQVRTELEAGAASLEPLQQDLEAAEAQLRLTAERQAHAMAESAAARERLRRLRDTEQRDAREAERLIQRAAVLAAEQAALRQERAEIDSQAEGADTPLAEAERAAALLEDAVRGNDAGTARLESDSDAVAAEHRQAQSDLADQRTAESQAAAEAERARGLLDHLQMELVAVCEALVADPAEILRADSPIAGELARVDDDALHSRLQRAQRELRSVGTVDYGVLADYGALRDRYSSITEQLEDLRQAELAIREGMAEARREIQERFAAAFEDVNERFKQSFCELFEGGDAELLLSGEPDSAQCSVDIVAQPPGKRLHRLATLSGGERALVGAALLLALIGANPSPFCVLDEVDAALDDANVQRFAAAIRAMATHTQFILVTHNRATMEMADVLYGVTMTGGAASQILSMRLPE